MDNEILSGFKIKFPSYSVITPQCGFNYAMRSLNVSEVEAMRQGCNTPLDALITINKTLYSAIESGPDCITSLDAFKKNTTGNDRGALLYATYIATYGEQRDFHVKCNNPECKVVYKKPLTVDLAKIFSMEAYPYTQNMKSSYAVNKALGGALDPVMEKITKKQTTHMVPPKGMPEEIARLDVNFSEYFKQLDKKRKAPSKEINVVEEPQVEKKEDDDMGILDRRLRIPLPKSKFIVTLKTPTLALEENIISANTYINTKQYKVLNDSAIIHSFENVDAQGNTAFCNSRTEILYLYENLPETDKELIIKDYNDKLGKYAIKLVHNWRCECGHSNPMEVDMLTLFFRRINQ